VPTAPQSVTASAGNGTITLSFTPPASNGGSAVTGYQASCAPGPFTGSSSSSPIVLTGLANGTAYTCSVAALNANGTGAAATANPAAPSQRSYSGASATGSGTVTASFTGGGAACTFATAQFIAVEGTPRSPPAGSAPPGVTFPHGLFDFTTTGCDPGSTLVFTVQYPSALPPGAVYWKYGPTPSNPAPRWYALPSILAGAQATFSITDGALGDDDLLANGAVIDQGGPATPPVANAIPTLSEIGQWLLALLLVVTATLRSRRTASESTSDDRSRRVR
jgi:hypothetical protein